MNILHIITIIEVFWFFLFRAAESFLVYHSILSLKSSFNSGVFHVKLTVFEFSCIKPLPTRKRHVQSWNLVKENRSVHPSAEPNHIRSPKRAKNSTQVFHEASHSLISRLRFWSREVRNDRCWSNDSWRNAEDDEKSTDCQTGSNEPISFWKL